MENERPPILVDCPKRQSIFARRAIPKFAVCRSDPTDSPLPRYFGGCHGKIPMQQQFNAGSWPDHPSIAMHNPDFTLAKWGFSGVLGESGSSRRLTEQIIYPQNGSFSFLSPPRGASNVVDRGPQGVTQLPLRSRVRGRVSSSVRSGENSWRTSPR